MEDKTMKVYQKPETIKVNLLGAFIMGTAESVASAIGNPSSVDETQGVGGKAPKIV